MLNSKRGCYKKTWDFYWINFGNNWINSSNGKGDSSEEGTPREPTLSQVYRIWILWIISGEVFHHSKAFYDVALETRKYSKFKVEIIEII